MNHKDCTHKFITFHHHLCIKTNKHQLNISGYLCYVEFIIPGLQPPGEPKRADVDEKSK